MMNVLIASIFILISTLAIVPFLMRRYRKRKLINKLPGPKGHFLIGSAWEFLNYPKDKRIEKFHELFDKYGFLFRLWIGLQPVVSIGNAEDIEILLSSRTNIDKALGYEFIEPWLGTGLLTSTGKKWAERRKLLTPAFHFSILNKFFDTIVENCNIFVEKLAVEENKDEFDVYPYVNNCALDIICETAMGVKVNAQKGASEYTDSIKNLLRQRITGSIDYHNDTLLLNKFEYCYNEITQSQEYEKNKAFLDLLLDICDQDNVRLTDADITEEVNTFMFEGHDTVSSAASWAIYLIGSHPDVQEKIFGELYSVFGSSQRYPTVNDLAKLKYLESVLKESLRLYPAVISIGRTLIEEVTLGGCYKIPVGTVIDLSIRSLHYNPKYYPNPDQFNPENFSAEACSKRHPFAYIPFSAGPRNCIGQKFALMEEKVMLSSLLRRYRFESMQKSEEVSQIGELVLRPGNGIKIRIFERKYSS